MKRGMLAVVFVFLAFAPNASATLQYAGETGKGCRACHLSQHGGQLTMEGEAYREGLFRERPYGRRVIGLIAGYLHMLMAVAWFGTILYVHIILKPAYAAGGLPKGELRLGWISFAAVGLTGIFLTLEKLRGFNELFQTRFGILLSVKIALYLVMLCSAAVVTLYIGPRLRGKKPAPPVGGKKDYFTQEELASYDGKQGRPAYVGFEGAVYDVSASRLWKKGEHLGRHAAGIDLTDAIKAAPHEKDRIAGMPLVGELQTGPAPGEVPFHVRLFYFFAYMNLLLVLVIVFIVSLWRWW